MAEHICTVRHMGTLGNQSQSSEWEVDNLPNRLTIFRILLIPIILTILTLMISDTPWANQNSRVLGYIACIIFAIASITDFFDGYIARKRKIVTVFGSFLDPIADKFLVVSSLIFLQYLDRIHILICIILVLREMYITSLRQLACNRGVALPVEKLGKVKTAFQMTAISMLLANDNLFGIIPLGLLGQIAIYVTSILSVYSALAYSLGLISKLQQKRRSRYGRQK